ncbi:hypothetical protein Pcac1_g10001 [Phytophthora cactorum]|uniref:Uncharacterized protein n=1 Tax=Phytophthora cactorum TaxID=29920 RepID=A0A8T1FS22_9STRA|nr:hypothetical protein Pcac1_g10001 [Phytophthora cactorum]KAG2981173.1 hypothetical protein PC118_g10768 [Phytophthora cactorum]
MRTHFTFEDEKDLVLLVRSYEDGGNRISWADTPHKMQRTGHPASTRKLRLPPKNPARPSPVSAIPKQCASQSTQRVQPDSSTQSVGEILVAAAAADLLAVAGASTNAQGAEVLCSVGLDAGKVEQVAVVDVAKVKQSAVVDAAELQDSEIVSVSDESAADANSETTVDDDDSLDAQFLTEDNLR